MNKETVIALAVQAGITPWVKKEWSRDHFVQTDEGMDGDAACLIQFAALVAAHEREECAKAVQVMALANPGRMYMTADQCATVIRSRKC